MRSSILSQTHQWKNPEIIAPNSLKFHLIIYIRVKGNIFTRLIIIQPSYISSTINQDSNKRI